MSMRSGLFGLAGVLAVAGATAAKPPDLPGEPLVEGREPTPLAREFYETDTTRVTPVATPAELPRAVPAWPVVDFLSSVRDTVLNRLTIPLGMTPVEE